MILPVKPHASCSLQYCIQIQCHFLAVQELAKPGTFGGNDSIVAFARNHGVNVVIHQLNEPRWVISGEEYSKAGRVIELHVSYHNGDHYSSVRSLFETDVSTPAWPHLKDRNLGSMVRSLLDITQGLKLGKRPVTSPVWRWCLTSLESWSKVCGTPWKLAMFSSSPLVWCWKRLFFPNLALPPPSIQCCFKGDTLSTLIQHCMGGGGMVKFSINGKCTMTLDQDCSHNFVAAREVLVTGATQLVSVLSPDFSPAVDQKSVVLFSGICTQNPYLSTAYLATCNDRYSFWILPVFYSSTLLSPLCFFQNHEMIILTSLIFF